MITYKGIDYPTRDLTVLMDGEAQDITIAPNSLQIAMTLELMETEGTEEQSIDEDIYFYIADEMLVLSDVEIATNLDEKFELADKITPPPHIEGKRQVTVIFGEMSFDDDNNTCIIIQDKLRLLVDIDKAEQFAGDFAAAGGGDYDDYLIPELYTGTII